MIAETMHGESTSPVILKRTLRTMAVGDVVPWAGNPRVRVLHNPHFHELVAHIRAFGQIDPIDVVPEGRLFRIVRGHRRYEAITSELHWPLIDAWVWFATFDEILPVLLRTEWLHRDWAGLDIGQGVNSLGLERLTPALRADDARVLQWAAGELAGDAELFRQMCEKYGARVFRMARRCRGEGWLVDRICKAILAHGDYRQLEERGTDRAWRQSILATWETDHAPSA